jgi:hypothetical protein
MYMDKKKPSITLISLEQTKKQTEIYILYFTLDIKRSIPVLVPFLELPSGRFAHYFQFLSGCQLSEKVIKQ